ncbi:protein associated with UVRAG as autophagy enhancer [Pelomyxa schiedti]|nr:protein associated with UVRAG as autophagy enhancer [Pelomyxa schiedti]
MMSGGVGEGVTRDRGRMMDDLVQCVNALLSAHVEANGKVFDDRYNESRCLCLVVERILLFGAKKSIGALVQRSKQSSLFGLSTGKSLSSALPSLSNVQTDDGYLRAWIRTGLNAGSLETQIQELIGNNPKTLYEDHAIMCSTDAREQALGLLSGLSPLHFALNTNTPLLDAPAEPMAVDCSSSVQVTSGSHGSGPTGRGKRKRQARVIVIEGPDNSSHPPLPSQPAAQPTEPPMNQPLMTQPKALLPQYSDTTQQVPAATQEIPSNNVNLQDIGNQPAELPPPLIQPTHPVQLTPAQPQQNPQPLIQMQQPSLQMQQPLPQAQPLPLTHQQSHQPLQPEPVHEKISPSETKSTAVSLAHTPETKINQPPLASQAPLKQPLSLLSQYQRPPIDRPAPTKEPVQTPNIHEEPPAESVEPIKAKPNRDVDPGLNNPNNLGSQRVEQKTVLDNSVSLPQTNTLHPDALHTQPQDVSNTSAQQVPDPSGTRFGITSLRVSDFSAPSTENRVEALKKNLEKIRENLHKTRELKVDLDSLKKSVSEIPPIETPPLHTPTPPPSNGRLQSPPHTPPLGITKLQSPPLSSHTSPEPHEQPQLHPINTSVVPHTTQMAQPKQSTQSASTINPSSVNTTDNQQPQQKLSPRPATQPLIQALSQPPIQSNTLSQYAQPIVSPPSKAEPLPEESTLPSLQLHLHQQLHLQLQESAQVRAQAQAAMQAIKVSSNPELQTGVTKVPETSNSGTQIPKESLQAPNKIPPNTSQPAVAKNDTIASTPTVPTVATTSPSSTSGNKSESSLISPVKTASSTATPIREPERNVSTSANPTTTTPSSTTTDGGSSNWTPPRKVLHLYVHKKPKPETANKLCYNCGAPLNFGLFSDTLYCEYTGKFFCAKCHLKEKEIIPARILHNWDFNRYPVSHYAVELLTSLNQEPTFDIGAINPTLYTKVAVLPKLKASRLQLTHLKDFIYSCSRLDPQGPLRRCGIQSYLYNSTETYSLGDLLDLEAVLPQVKEVVEKWTQHVTTCKLCCARASICEVCKSPDPLFPFQLNVAVQCPLCFGVFHKNCFIPSMCPRCVRFNQRKKKATTTSTPTTPPLARMPPQSSSTTTPSASSSSSTTTATTSTTSSIDSIINAGIGVLAKKNNN